MTEPAPIRIGVLDIGAGALIEQVRTLIERGATVGDQVPAVVPFASLDVALGELHAAAIDALVSPARQWLGLAAEQIAWLGALPRRDPFPVLVSEDRPTHLPRRGIIVTGSPLLRRQLRRFRGDLHTHEPLEWGRRTERPLPDAVGRSLEASTEGPSDPHFPIADEVGMLAWLEDERMAGHIDGYTVSGAAWRASGARSRRHRLGLHVGTKPQHGANELGARFLPSPGAGLALVHIRAGFPRGWMDSWLDEEAHWSWALGRDLHEATPDEHRPYLGAWAEVRKVGAVLRDAVERDDPMVLEAKLTPEGRVADTRRRVILQAELLGARGRRTLAIERIGPVDDTRLLLLRLMEDWRAWLEAGMHEQPADPRLGPEVPAFLG